MLWVTAKLMSMPIRSISSKGPMLKPAPSLRIRSTCRGGATPSSTMRRASTGKGRATRFTTKPGVS